jgi:uncharacterized membrane protein
LFEIFQNQIILFALILKVITSICNETIFLLIVKSTLAKLCGVGIVYLILLLTEYFKAVTSYRGERFQVPTCLTTVTRQTGEYKVDLTCHPKFPLAVGERSFPTL